MKKKSNQANSVDDTIQELASALFEIGVIDKKTMRKFDKNTLTPIHEFTPEQLRKLREREKVSQAVLADYLNVSASFISKCERGERKPDGGTLKLLVLAEQRGLDAIA
ncbi:transcriptional regulator, XRE family protein [Bartonella australis AUST/NH1]|uniref:Transcriptional regulator, XRE family protein n=1 Tax=Bartonella australis (strain Aust/NH1) TaxID=1094489 RepID=M1P2T1_BARAA|nr:helix-turn-helix domain-containing protein [Bartonella australis]AGF74125.1 transcriptional regulator, XRE family protein [Bartonella australis AUST/NH1]